MPRVCAKAKLRDTVADSTHSDLRSQNRTNVEFTAFFYLFLAPSCMKKRHIMIILILRGRTALANAATVANNYSVSFIKISKPEGVRFFLLS
jgi:hypothetical protein